MADTPLRAARWLTAAMLAALVVLPVDTSCTPAPKCAPGQTAQRLPSHQHYMWTCAPGGPAS